MPMPLRGKGGDAPVNMPPLSDDDGFKSEEPAAPSKTTRGRRNTAKERANGKAAVKPAAAKAKPKAKPKAKRGRPNKNRCVRAWALLDDFRTAEPQHSTFFGSEHAAMTKFIKELIKDIEQAHAEAEDKEETTKLLKLLNAVKAVRAEHLTNIYLGE